MLKQQHTRWRHSGANRRLYSHQLQNLNPASAITATNHMKATVDIEYRNVVERTRLLCNDDIGGSLRQDTFVTRSAKHRFSRNTKVSTRILIKKFLLLFLISKAKVIVHSEVYFGRAN
jgi:hypothetical protein